MKKMKSFVGQLSTTLAELLLKNYPEDKNNNGSEVMVSNNF